MAPDRDPAPAGQGDAGVAAPPRLTRRRLLTAGALAAGGLAIGVLGGVIGYRWPHPTTGSSTSSPASNQVFSFVSRPDLTPPLVTTSLTSGLRFPESLPHQVVIAPRAYGSGAPGQQGLMVLGPNGLQWFRASEQFPMNLKVQSYQGKPVLTWWEGQIINGYGVGTGQIYDDAYQPVATVAGGSGLQADLHEFLLTPDGSAWITAYKPVEADLTAVGGPKSGAQVLDGVVLQVEVATGQVLFEWHSLDHIALTESYSPSPGSAPTVPFDYFHVNSIDLAPDGNVLISARNTCAVYKISRSSGAVIWRLNGRRSDFAMGDGSHFFYQHDARAHGSDTVSIFDDGASPPEEEQSRGIVLQLDLTHMRATLQRQFTHPSMLLAPNQGNLQLQPNGGAFIGWGAQPYFSLFSPEGDLQFGGRMPNNVQSYRAYLQEWTGTPSDRPALAVRSSDVGGVSLYASWNGATQVASWEVLAGADSGSLKPVARDGRTGFETAISVTSTGPYYVAVALDREGRELGRSEPATVPH